MDKCHLTHPVWLKFSDPKVALKYPSEFRSDRRREMKEKECIANAFKYFPDGGHILDLPCGSGRLTKMLLEAGYKVTAADISPVMLRLAEKNCLKYQADSNISLRKSQFKLVDIRDTGFRDNEFDGVVCYRLFHHFQDSDTRREALAEIQRISCGPVFISFFNSFSVSAFMRKGKYMIKRKPMVDRIPINMSLFMKELKSEGLLPVKKIPVRWGISPKWNLITIPYRRCAN